MTLSRRKFVFAGLAAVGGTVKMEADEARIDLKALRPNDKFPVNAIRLLNEKGAARLFFSRTEAPPPAGGRYAAVVSSMPVPNGASAEDFRVSQLLPGVAEWDVCAAQSGRNLVIARFGGAVASLNLHHAGGQTALTEFDSSDDFKDPRFSRGNHQPPFITSVVDGSRVDTLAPAGGGYGQPQTALTEPQIDSALVVSNSHGDWLLFKVHSLGPMRRRFPGALHAVRLGADHKPTGAPFQPLGDRMIFEFDADVFENGIAIAATTGNGFLLAAGELPALRPLEYKHPGALLQPALVQSGDGVQLAFLESPATELRHVLTAFVPAASLRPK
jgi:hypothetical protein